MLRQGFEWTCASGNRPIAIMRELKERIQGEINALAKIPAKNN
jgi:hypothetical protein